MVNVHDTSMLIGVHVSPAGGLPNAVARGIERDCDAIQIFSQSPRRWAPANHSDEDVAAFREALAASRISQVLIHALYLCNAATDDPDLRAKSLTALVHSLRVGAAIGASGVILHPGSAKTGDPAAGIARAGEVFREALAETEGCDLLLEDTAGAGGTLGRSFEELAALTEAAGGGPRIGLCLDTCHLLASGYDVRTQDGIDATLDECDRLVGLHRLRCLHVNDSNKPLGSNRDSHAAPGEGEIGWDGCALLLSEPRFEGLPAIFEGPGLAGSGAELEDVARMRELRAAGLALRKAKRAPRK